MSAIKLYRPANGTDGTYFMAEFCDRCSKGINDQACPILGNALFFAQDHPGYPEQWNYDEQRKPRCTAFELAEGMK